MTRDETLKCKKRWISYFAEFNVDFLNRCFSLQRRDFLVY